MHNPRIRQLINQIEDKVFDGKVKLFQVFRKFDKDGDGYVSYDDFQKCLKSIKVQASPDEVQAVLKHIDRNDNGYLDFSEFSKVFRPDMSERLVNVPQNDRHLPNLIPSKEVNEDNRAHHKQMLETMNEFKKTFQPSQYSDQLKVPSRFSAKPDFGSTFVNYQHPERCPGHLEENVRFKGTADGFMKEKKERMEGTRSSIGVK